MAEIIKEFVRYIIYAQKPYSESGMMMALYFVALMIIAFYCKDVIIKKSFVIPSVILIGIMYIGIPLIRTVIGYPDYYVGRTFWILITPIITAIGITLFITGIGEARMRILALALLFPIFMYCGSFKLSNSMFYKPENAYRLPQSTVDITEHVLAETEDPKLIVPYTIAHPFRQISTDVYLLYGENASSGRIIGASDDIRKVSDQMELVTPDLNYIVPLAREHDVDYILFDTIYTEFCKDGNINIYGYPEDENYVADRTATVSFDELRDISVIDDESGIYWDLSEYGLKYEGTFGQYILYRFL